MPASPNRLTSGPITPALIKLAWPVFAARALHTLYGTADTAWVGRLGPEAIAAVSTCFFASWALYSVGDILVSGVTALVSQSVGARRDDEAMLAARTGFVLAIGLGVVVGTAGYLGSRPLFALLFDDPAIVRMGAEYFSIFSLVTPVLYLVFVAESVYRSCGDSRTPFHVALVGTLLNIALDPFLILGIGPFPRLEVRGAAIATVISETVTLVAFLVLILRGKFPLTAAPGGGWFSRRRARQMVAIGTPHALIGILYSVVYLFLAKITGAFGAAATAALGIVNRLESITYLTSSAMGIGVATLVGQSLGAGLPDRAATSAHRGAKIQGAIAAALMVVFFVFAEPLCRIFTSSPEAIRESARFLRIVSISQIFMGWELVYAHAFTGAGDTLPPMYTSVLTSVVRIPLAWWLALGLALGTDGIWWTISLTGIVRGLILALWFRREKWRSRDLGITPAASLPRTALGPEGPEG